MKNQGFGLFLLLLLFGVVVYAPACEITSESTGQKEKAVSDDDDVTEATGLYYPDPPGCDASLNPIIFVYGILENGDSFYTQSMRFTSNGYCLDRIYSYDWNAFEGYVEQAPALAEFVDEVLTETGASKVDIIAHSLGAGLGREYLALGDHAEKIAHYAQIAALPCKELPANIPRLNISSADDLIIGVCELENTENRILQGLDHLQTATSATTFEEVYEFFRDGNSPDTTEVIPEEEIRLSGRTVIYAQNIPVANVQVHIYQVDPATGERLSEEPDGSFATEGDGKWGPFDAEPGAYYEFLCLDPDGHWPPLHYYREPFVRSSNMIYLRVYPEPETPLGRLFGLASFDENVAAFSWININQAVISGRDELKVNGIELSTMEIADPSYTTIVIVFGDINFNGISDEAFGGSLLPSRFYVQFFDLIVPTQPREPIVFTFNGRSLAVPGWKANSEGVSTAVFE